MRPSWLGLVAVVLSAATGFSQNITLNLVNENPSLSVPYVTFVQALVTTQTWSTNGESSTTLLGPALSATANSQSLQNGVAYSFADLGGTSSSATISLSPNWAGNIFFSNGPLALGQSGQSPVQSPNPTPPPAFSIPQFSQAPFFPTNPNGSIDTDTLRYNYIELAGGSATQINPDITYINYYSVPIQLTRSSDNATRGQPSSQSALAALPGKLTAISSNSSTVVVNDANGVARIISPDNGNTIAAVYDSFSDYIETSFDSGATPIDLSNSFSGVQNPQSARYAQQTYTGTSVTYTGSATTSGTLTITGTSSNSDIGAYTLTWTGTATDLSNAIYQAVLAGYSVTYLTGSFSGGNTGDNDVFSAITRDLLAGYNFGFINSATEHNSETVGSLSSEEWMTLGYGYAFDHAQTNPLYYNQWAAAFADTFTDVYTFPFNDFFSGFSPTLAVNSGETLTITLLNPVPEPSTFALVALGLLGAGAMVRSRKKKA